MSRHEHIVFEKYWQGTGFDTLEDGQSFARVVTALAGARGFPNARSIGRMSPSAISSLPGTTIPAVQSRSVNFSRCRAACVPPSPRSTRGAPVCAARSGPDILTAALAEPLAAKPGSVLREQSADPQLLAPSSNARPVCAMRTSCRSGVASHRRGRCLAVARSTGRHGARRLLYVGPAGRLDPGGGAAGQGWQLRGEEVSVRAGSRGCGARQGDAAYGSYVRLGKAANAARPEPYAATTCTWSKATAATDSGWCLPCTWPS